MMGCFAGSATVLSNTASVCLGSRPKGALEYGGLLPAYIKQEQIGR